MSWLDRLLANPNIQTVLIADNQGRVLHSSRPLSSEDELVASMVQAADVLANTILSEFGRGPIQMLQISTSSEHLLIFPLPLSSFHLVLIVDYEASLKEVLDVLERLLPEIDLSALSLAREQPLRPAITPLDDSELDANELIEAVREWLQGRASSNPWD